MTSRRDVSFVIGTASPPPMPDQAEKMLKDYLRHDARLDDLVRRAITSPVRPKPKLRELVLRGDKGRISEHDHDPRVLREQAADLMDEVQERSDRLAEIETALAAGKGAALKGSEAHAMASQCLAVIQTHRAKVERSMREVHVPKTTGVPAKDLQSIHAAASAMLAAGVVIDVAVQAIRRALAR